MKKRNLIIESSEDEAENPTEQTEYPTTPIEPLLEPRPSRPELSIEQPEEENQGAQEDSIAQTLFETNGLIQEDQPNEFDESDESMQDYLPAKPTKKDRQDAYMTSQRILRELQYELPARKSKLHISTWLASRTKTDGNEPDVEPKDQDTAANNDVEVPRTDLATEIAEKVKAFESSQLKAFKEPVESDPLPQPEPTSTPPQPKPKLVPFERKEPDSDSDCELEIKSTPLPTSAKKSVNQTVISRNQEMKQLIRKQNIERRLREEREREEERIERERLKKIKREERRIRKEIAELEKKSVEKKEAVTNVEDVPVTAEKEPEPKVEEEIVKGNEHEIKLQYEEEFDSGSDLEDGVGLANELPTQDTQEGTLDKELTGFQDHVGDYFPDGDNFGEDGPSQAFINTPMKSQVKGQSQSIINTPAKSEIHAQEFGITETQGDIMGLLSGGFGEGNLEENFSEKVVVESTKIKGDEVKSLEGIDAVDEAMQEDEELNEEADPSAEEENGSDSEEEEEEIIEEEVEVEPEIDIQQMIFEDNDSETEQNDADDENDDEEDVNDEQNKDSTIEPSTQIAETQEEEEEVMAPVKFSVIQPVVKRQDKPAFVLTEAEVEQDEFQHYGGIEGEAAGQDEYDKSMLADSDTEIDIQKLMQLHQEKLAQDDAQELGRLIQDVTSGVLRKRKAKDAMGLDLYDSDEETEAILRRIRQQMGLGAKKKNEGDPKSLSWMAMNAKTKAFAECFIVKEEKNCFLSSEGEEEIVNVNAKLNVQVKTGRKVKKQMVAKEETNNDEIEVDENQFVVPVEFTKTVLHNVQSKPNLLKSNSGRLLTKKSILNDNSKEEGNLPKAFSRGNSGFKLALRSESTETISVNSAKKTKSSKKQRSVLVKLVNTGQ